MRRPTAAGRHPPEGLDDEVAGVLHDLRRLDLHLRCAVHAALGNAPGQRGDTKHALTHSPASLLLEKTIQYNEDTQHESPLAPFLNARRWTGITRPQEILPQSQPSKYPEAPAHSCLPISTG